MKKILAPLLSISLLAATPSLATAGQTISFSTNAFTTGASPTSVAWADINGDGKPDLITSDQDDNSVTILTNNGAGYFTLMTTLSVGPSPQFVLSTDINGDGKPDLVTANGGLRSEGFIGSLTVLTNAGNGIFQTASSPTVGGFAICVAALDVNGDGKPDLISADNNDNTLTVLTNSFAGQFTLASIISVGNSPLFVAGGDFNGDGRPDLVSADQLDGQLTVVTNKSAGQFSFAASYLVGSGANSSPYCVAVADLNYDGKLDLVSANNNDNSLTVLTNNGSGLFAVSSSPAVGNLPSYVTVGDINGDGRPDLISADSNDDKVSILTNSPSGQFSQLTRLGVGTRPSSVAVVDLNNDTTKDIVTADNFDNSVTVLLQLASPRLSVQQQGNNVVVLWNSSFPDFILQTNSSLSGTTWGNVNLPVITTDVVNRSVNVGPPSAAKMFYRLVRQ